MTNRNSKKRLWETCLNMESKDSHWEITNNKKNKIVNLRYVPKDIYTDSDPNMDIPLEHFDELLKFFRRISKHEK